MIHAYCRDIFLRNGTLNLFLIDASRTEDGTPSPRINSTSQHKLLTAMNKYKSDYESAKSEEATKRQSLDLAKNGYVS